MNHRLKFRWVADRGLTLVDVWCPADHGGECDTPEVSDELHDPECALWSDRPGGVDPEECDCGGYGPTGRCWTKHQLEDWVYEGAGWLDVLRSGIDLPWVAVTIDGPGPDGNEPININVIAELADKPAPTVEQLTALEDLVEQMQHEWAAAGGTLRMPPCEYEAAWLLHHRDQVLEVLGGPR